MKQFSMSADRIITIYGGYRAEREMEFWLVPTGAMPPTASPTVE